MWQNPRTRHRRTNSHTPHRFSLRFQEAYDNSTCSCTNGSLAWPRHLRNQLWHGSKCSAWFQPWNAMLAMFALLDAFSRRCLQWHAARLSCTLMSALTAHSRACICEWAPQRSRCAAAMVDKDAQRDCGRRVQCEHRGTYLPRHLFASTQHKSTRETVR